MGSEYKLDFTAYLPKEYLPTYNKAASAYTQTVNQAPLDVTFRQQKPGVFVLKTNSAKDSKKIEASKVRYSYGKHEQKDIAIPFKKVTPWQFYENPKWLTIEGMYDSGLQLATNEDFDEILIKYGTLIVKTHDDTEVHGMRTGRKKARIDLKVDIERFSNVEIDVVTKDGDDKRAKGRIKVFYQGQPVMCRDCDVHHIGKCPEKVKREAEEKDREEKRKSEIHTLMMGDSNLRRVNEKATRAKTDVASGAKIGHAANSLSFEDPAEYNHLVINVGVNNIDTNRECNLEQWKAQTEYEVKQLKAQIVNFADKGAKTVVLAIPDTPIADYSAKTKEMKKIINQQLSKTVQEVNSLSTDSAAFITVKNVTESPEESWEDDLHMTEIMTANMMEATNAQISTWAGGEEDLFILRGVKLTSEKKYGQVNGTYRVGCGRCTRRGHSEEHCSVTYTKKHKLSSSSDNDARQPPQKK